MKKEHTTEEYNYHLPEDRIAKFPLERREDSKLLVYNRGQMESATFSNIINYLPKNSFLLFNDTKVIEARLYFYKKTGARIEVFLLNPIEPSKDVALAMKENEQCTWKCTIGNKKKWNNDLPLEINFLIDKMTVKLTATMVDKVNDVVSFSWNSGHSFAEVIHYIGKIPIPPYLHREKEQMDDERYQTVYSMHKGAVAAPTAGLHFTNEIIKSLPRKSISTGYVTLHVGAGTFKPIQEADYRLHDMHMEQIIIDIVTLQKLLQHEMIICVGTTSLRVLETIYWIGVKILKKDKNPFTILKNDPYEHDHSQLPSASTSLQAVVNFMVNHGMKELHSETQIFVYPGYEFKLCKGLLTNFHLPKSTLLLLISALIGTNWKKVYEFGLMNNYRFLSYGDSSLLFP